MVCWKKGGFCYATIDFLITLLKPRGGSLNKNASPTDLKLWGRSFWVHQTRALCLSLSLSLSVTNPLKSAEVIRVQFRHCDPSGCLPLGVNLDSFMACQGPVSRSNGQELRRLRQQAAQCQVQGGGHRLRRRPCLFFFAKQLVFFWGSNFQPRRSASPPVPSFFLSLGASKRGFSK